MQNNHALLRASGRRRPRRRGQRRLFFSLLCEQKKKPTANLQKSQKPKKNALGKKKTAARSPAGKTKGAFRSHPPRRIARYKAKMTLFHSIPFPPGCHQQALHTFTCAGRRRCRRSRRRRRLLLLLLDHLPPRPGPPASQPSARWRERERERSAS